MILIYNSCQTQNYYNFSGEIHIISLCYNIVNNKIYERDYIINIFVLFIKQIYSLYLLSKVLGMVMKPSLCLLHELLKIHIF